MNNFYYYNPTKIIFGKGMLPRITSELLGVQKVLLLYGQGSIKTSGLYEKTLSVLNDAFVSFVEFGGIEPNPDFSTALKAIELVRNEEVDFILAIGGGSVIDAAKFIALCAYSNDPWGVVAATTPPPETILSIGTVCTVPGSGSEMNNAFVLSKRSNIDKRPFSHIKLYPKFSLLDPENTYSLSKHQSALGIVDTFVHVLEQYMTYSVAAPLHERQSEAILMTLCEIAPALLASPENYDLRATMMWCSVQALNSTLSRGVPVDWATHEIGHALTALYDLPHAQTLSLVVGGVYRYLIESKMERLAQYGRRVWSLNGSDEEVARESISKTEIFFESLGLSTRFSQLGLQGESVAKEVCSRLDQNGFKNLGERALIDLEAVATILKSAS